VPLTTFHLAEDYHQKWRLRRYSGITAEFEAIYPNLDAFTRSTAVTRANAYLAGYGTRDQLDAEIGKLGLSAEAQEKLRAAIRE
jgi:peptide-methionine (S)-S-oxide reductase